MKLISADRALAAHNKHRVIPCDVERIGNNPHTANYNLYNLIHVADAIKQHFSPHAVNRQEII